MLMAWGIFAMSSYLLKRTTKNWPCLLGLFTIGALAGAHIMNVSWKGYGANFSRMIALQIIVAILAVFIHYMRTNKKCLISTGLLYLSIALVWLIISSQWLHLHMIFDVSLLDQRIMILLGESIFLSFAYFGWISPQKTERRR